MTRRLFTDDLDAHQPTPSNLTVYEPVRTGLLDADGNPLVRERAPLGFDLSPREIR